MMQPDENSEFGRLLGQAVKLKGEQVKQDRRKFERWPEHLQHSLFHADEANQRALAFAPRLEAARSIKAEGNALYKQKDLQGAIELYERALGLMRYVVNRKCAGALPWARCPLHAARTQLVVLACVSCAIALFTHASRGAQATPGGRRRALTTKTWT